MHLSATEDSLPKSRSEQRRSKILHIKSESLSYFLTEAKLIHHIASSLQYYNAVWYYPFEDEYSCVGLYEIIWDDSLI